MGGKRLTKEEFCDENSIYRIMTEMPRQKREKQDEYLDRLSKRCGIPQGKRYMQQIIENVVRQKPANDDEAYDMYNEIYDERYEKKHNRKKAEKQPEQEQKPEGATAEEQIKGQIRMDLDPKEKQEEHEETLGDMQTKMMRFQAEMTSKICEKITAQSLILNETLLVKLDRLNDTLSMILRAVRKE